MRRARGHDFEIVSVTKPPDLQFPIPPPPTPFACSHGHSLLPTLSLPNYESYWSDRLVQALLDIA